MKTIDDYNFDLVSHSQEPGFEILQNPDTGSWHCLANDAAAHPVLFSPALPTEASAQRTLSMMLGLLKNKRPSLTEAADGWQFVLQTVKGQEIGRSRSFPDKSLCKQALEYCQRVAASPDPMAGKVGARALPIVASGNTAVRYSFRLHFYPGDAGMLSGQIQNLDNNAQKTLKGLDMEELKVFLEEQLPVELFNAPKAPPSVSSKKQSGAATQATLASAVVWPDSRETEIVLKGETLPEYAAVLGCAVEAKHIEGKQSFLLPHTTVRANTQNGLSLVLGPEGFPKEGTYHIDAQLWLRPEFVSPLRATGWIQVL